MCRQKLTYKLESIPNIIGCSDEERCIMLNLAKDEVVQIIYDNRFRWGYANWVQMTKHVQVGEYHKLIPIIKACKPSKSRTIALQYLDDIKALKGCDC